MAGATDFMDLSFQPTLYSISKSTLPQDSERFERNGNAVVLRYDPRCVVRCRAGRRRSRPVDVAARYGWQLPNTRHLLPRWTIAVDAVGIQLYSRGIRVKTIEIDLDLEHVLLPVSLDTHLTEASAGHPFQGVLPIDGMRGQFNRAFNQERLF
jgi:hypothetical protein